MSLRLLSPAPFRFESRDSLHEIRSCLRPATHSALLCPVPVRGRLPALRRESGLYDHVPAQTAKSPDGIKAVDLRPGDICTTATGPTCDFTYTGYRVPLIVISPYAKKHYVNHQVADYTAILKLIETRFNLPALTRRDAAQINMTHFFNFNSPPWKTPPAPPPQNTSGGCYLNQLP